MTDTTSIETLWVTDEEMIARLGGKYLPDQKRKHLSDQCAVSYRVCWPYCTAAGGDHSAFTMRAIKQRDAYFTRERTIMLLGVSDGNFDLLVDAGTLPAPTIDKRGNETWPFQHCERRVGGLHTVYFMRCEEFIKIGFTTVLSRRHAELSASSAYPLLIVHAIRGDKSVEAHIHDRFNHINIHGEWFEAAPELLSYIGAMK